MPTPSADRDLVLGITPFHQPNADLVVAVERAGYLGVLDLGADGGTAVAALDRVRRRLGGRPFGVRLHGDFTAGAAGLPPEVDTVVLDPVTCQEAGPGGTPDVGPVRVLAEVTSAQEAAEALRLGASGLVARGFEAGGRVGELSTFVLVQRLAAAFPGIPVWAMGGIGPHTAAAAVAGGARGVAIDAQLALTAEAGLPGDVVDALTAMDGGETFAAPLAARYKTAGGVIRAIGAAVGTQIELAAKIEPLRDAMPVQGPMTQVSDRAGFAAAVADGGGLPFLALALMPGDQAAELLAETAVLLGGRPWGAGILGFAPPEIRDAQLAAIMRTRPPYAVIAGGRPSQAAALQDAGIETFLPVPSPGLLGQFLSAGTRRFIFEGAECGGRTGPHGSFALWEAAVARLLEQPDLTGVHAWFAGGVHDERSAAMVAAMAAPLAERGARVGLLMGTAYLFTREIVESGAVNGLYQRIARECTGTALLETSPGQVIRCADTPYVAAFAAAKERLAATGASQQDARAELEQLSLERLWVAAKGLRRDGDDLVGVDEEAARGDGMFMLGQVAALRLTATTVAALHEQVTTGAAGFLAARAADLREAAAADGGPSAGVTRPQPLDVAIVGMACLYPGADGVDRFWANVVAGTDPVGGFMPPVPFDALSYGIPPSALASIEPVQLLALEVAARALADAGYAGRPFDRSRASVIFGTGAGSDLLGNVISGRIANRLDLGGVNYSVDAACASSLAALDLACKELSAGTSDLVLCGGADTHHGIRDDEMFASVRALSPNGRCASFDAQADGITPGEGVGCVVLKRLTDAERDGDRVYAVVKGVGGSSSGRSPGLTAPGPEGQRLALDRAYAMAGVSPAQVGLVEAHGTGTVAADRAEFATLTAVFTEAGAEPGGCALGSVKSQVGHTKCAAGLAGLIKVACALHTGTRPGTIHPTTPNSYWESATSPFSFATGRARPWPAAPGERHAGVSAFGVGGTNFHAVLSGYDGADAPAHGLREWPAELFALRGDVTEAAAELGELAAASNAAGRPWRLAELAATMAARPGPVRAAFVAGSLDELDQRLREPFADARQPAPAHSGAVQSREVQSREVQSREVQSREVQPGEVQPGETALLFPGQGSQQAGMTADLFTAFPRLQRLLRLAEPGCAAAMFPPAAFTRADRERQTAAITDTPMAQPALGIAGLAVWELLAMSGVRPGMAAGHSDGELTALCAAGAYDEATLLELSAARAAAILAATGEDPAAMDAALARQDVAEPRFPVYANSTAAPCAGTPDEVRRLLAGQVADPVRFAEQVEAMYAAGARTFVEAGPGRTLTGLVGQILAGRPHTAVACDVPGENGLRRFLDALSELVAAGVAVDPGPLFAGRAAPVAGPPARPAWTVDGRLVRTADGEPVTGGPRAAAPRLVLGAGKAGHGPAERDGMAADRDPVVAERDGMAADRDPVVAERDGMAADRDSVAADRDSVMADFLRTTRELIALQREVLLGYLGADSPPAAPPSSSADPERKPLPPHIQPPAVPAAQPAPTGGAHAPDDRPAAQPAAAGGVHAPDDRPAVQPAAASGVRAPDGRPAADGGLGSVFVPLKRLVGRQPAVEEPVAAPLPRRTPNQAGPGRQAPAATADGRAKTGRPRRFLIEPVSLAPAEPGAGTLTQGRFLIVDDGRGIALELADLLEQRGAEAVVTETPAAGDLLGASALVHLGALRPGGRAALPAVFGLVRDALAVGARSVLVATAGGGTFGYPAPAGRQAHHRTPHHGLPRYGVPAYRAPDHGTPGHATPGHATPGRGALASGTWPGWDDEPADLGLRGLIRTVAAEYPGVLARAVDVEAKNSPRETAAQLLTELYAPTGPSVVGYLAGRRTGLQIAEVAPPGTGLAGSAGLGLDSGSVVLLTGGARGITALAALALARATGCHIELIGRTPPPGPADPELDTADPVALHQALIARSGLQGRRGPREIEAETTRLLHEREVRGLLDRLRATAASVRCHVADVRDAAAVGAVLADVYARFGRIDGVIHGAGVVEDRLIADKTPDSFTRVYQTKVEGARALAAGLRDDVRFLVLFGSASGVFGSRGQADYAAASDALDTLARYWSTRTGHGGPSAGDRLAGRGAVPAAGPRVLAVDWGPWAGGGMVSPELEREYARRGVPLIDPADGVNCLLAEIADPAGPAQVVYLCGELPQPWPGERR